ncbi:hypothetical protein HDU67_002641 [Dinochytrium kinnereticum]|nr:hypothetical protein HDU67_002641 [Dinochytrium kinnereticum]
MLEYVQRGTEAGYSIMILNSNKNTGPSGGYIRGSENPERHVEYVWKSFVKDAKTATVLIVAHSYGGVCVSNLRLAAEIGDKVKAIAFTDSVHRNHFQNEQASDLMKRVLQVVSH